METKLEQIAAKAAKQQPKSVVREIRTPRSVGTGGRRLPPVTRCGQQWPSLPESKLEAAQRSIAAAKPACAVGARRPLGTMSTCSASLPTGFMCEPCIYPDQFSLGIHHPIYSHRT